MENKNGMRSRKIFFCYFIALLSGGVGLRLSAQTIDPLQSEVLSITGEVESENRMVDMMHPDSINSLPIGINKEIAGTRYLIAIDSATFRPGTSTFSAYMALEFPGSQNKICFAAKNVGFNPVGVFATSSSKLMLVSEHRISLGPKVMMILKPDGSNYVEWDCNGFQSVNLKGYFEFDPAAIYGVKPDGTPNDSTVRASFEIHCNDVHNFICQLNMSPFSVKGMTGFVFTVTDATVDMSEVSNHQTMSFPSGYNLEPGMSPEMWTGFYLKSFKVKLPPELKRKDGTTPEIFASNMIFDNTGLTGVFGANNVFTISNGSASGWALSLDNINVHLTQNHLNGGGLAGKIRIPAMKTTEFNYTAIFAQNNYTNELDYAFSVQPKSNVSMEAFSAKVTLNNNSILTVAKSNGKLVPEAKLSGSITIENTDWQQNGLAFQDLVIATQSPYIKSGVFSLTGNGTNKIGSFPISISAIGFNIHPTAPALFADVALNLMGSEDFSFSAETRVIALAKIIPPQTSNDNPDFQLDRVMINNIAIEVSTQPYHLAGAISWKSNDPVYGKGFYGGITVEIEGVLDGPMSSSVWFGSVNNMKYWYVDITVPVDIPVYGIVRIKRLKGSLSYHMNQSQSAGALASNIHNDNTLTAPLTFTPDSTKGIHFKAGLFFHFEPHEKTGNGDVVLSVLFNSPQVGGGLNSVSLDGNVWFLVTRNERQSSTAKGSMNMVYDHMTHTFHAVFQVNLNLPQLSGNGTAVIHFAPDLWYICLGKPSQKITLSIGTGYFMAGQQLEPMSPPPAQLLALVNSNGLSNGRNDQALNNASGWVIGVSAGTYSSGAFGISSVELYYGFSVYCGFDLMLMNYGTTAHCAGSTDKIGINGWYAQGQFYAQIGGDVGLRGTVLNQNFDINIFHFSAGALLAGQAPRPLFLTGAVGCDYDILGGAISGHVNFNYSIGNYCNVQQ